MLTATIFNQWKQYIQKWIVFWLLQFIDVVLLPDVSGFFISIQCNYHLMFHQIFHLNRYKAWFLYDSHRVDMPQVSLCLVLNTALIFSSSMPAIKDISVWFLIQLGDSEDENAHTATLISLKVMHSHGVCFETHSLPTLHTKVIIVDNDLAHVSSTNLYRYSIEKSLEVTLRDSLSTMADLQATWRDIEAKQNLYIWHRSFSS